MWDAFRHQHAWPGGEIIVDIMTFTNCHLLWPCCPSEPYPFAVQISIFYIYEELLKPTRQRPTIVHLYNNIYHVPGSMLSTSSVNSHVSLTRSFGGRFYDYLVFLRLREVKSLAQGHRVTWPDFMVHVHKVGAGMTATIYWDPRP